MVDENNGYDKKEYEEFLKWFKIMGSLIKIYEQKYVTPKQVEKLIDRWIEKQSKWKKVLEKIGKGHEKDIWFDFLVFLKRKDKEDAKKVWKDVDKVTEEGQKLIEKVLEDKGFPKPLKKDFKELVAKLQDVEREIEKYAHLDFDKKTWDKKIITKSVPEELGRYFVPLFTLLYNFIDYCKESMDDDDYTDFEKSQIKPNFEFVVDVLKENLDDLFGRSEPWLEIYEKAKESSVLEPEVAFPSGLVPAFREEFWDFIKDWNKKLNEKPLTKVEGLGEYRTKWRKMTNIVYNYFLGEVKELKPYNDLIMKGKLLSDRWDEFKFRIALESNEIIKEVYPTEILGKFVGAWLNPSFSEEDAIKSNPADICAEIVLSATDFEMSPIFEGLYDRDIIKAKELRKEEAERFPDEKVEARWAVFLSAIRQKKELIMGGKLTGQTLVEAQKIYRIPFDKGTYIALQKSDGTFDIIVVTQKPSN